MNTSNIPARPELLPPRGADARERRLRQLQVYLHQGVSLASFQRGPLLFLRALLLISGALTLIA